MKTFHIKEKAIVNSQKVEIETYCGDINWLVYTLDAIYGIKVSKDKARRLAKNRLEIAAAKPIYPSWKNVTKRNIPKTLSHKDHELTVLIF